MKNHKQDMAEQGPILVEQTQNGQYLKLSEKKYVFSINENILSGDVFNVFNALLSEPELEEIMYDGPAVPLKVYHRRYGLCETNAMIDEPTIKVFVEEIVKYNNKTIGPSAPLFDGVLWDGSRINITVPPATKTTTITIRKFARQLITIIDLMKAGTLSPETGAFLWCAIEGLGYKPANMLIVGGTASGKTTFLNSVSFFIPFYDRIIVIEDTPELQLKHPNLVRMVSKKEQNITMDMLLKNTLRMRPDRIIVGEVRGPEASTMFTAMNTGHDGVMGTLHANSAFETINRITNPPMNVPYSMLGALDIIVVLKRIATPQGLIRVIHEISEISSVSGNVVRFNPIFKYNPKTKKTESTGIPSRLKPKLAMATGMSAKDINFIIKDRKRILKRMLELSKTKTFPPGLLQSIIEKNRSHWLDEKNKSAINRLKSSIRRLFKKEDVLYL